MPATAPEPTRASVDRRRPRVKLAALGVLALVATVVLPAAISAAATNVELGAAGSFAVLGASTVTNTGPTTVWGDVGVDPGTAVTGFAPGGPGIVGGTIHADDAVAQQAQADAQIAYNALAAQPCAPENNLTDKDLGGLTLVPGVYCFDTSAQLTGALTLNALADPAAVFIFRTGSTLTTATDSSVQFTNSFATCNVFWQIGSSATLGTRTDFVGTVIAQAAVTANANARVQGRLIARTEAVTLDSNVITQPLCPAAPAPPTFVPPVDETPVDETPVDETPVEEAPVDETPVEEDDDETPVEGSPTEPTPGDDSSGGERAGGPGAPLTPTGGPSVPSLTGGPGVPTSSRPPLPYTGSNMVLAVFGVLAILVGAGLVVVTDPSRMNAARPSSSGPVGPSVGR